MSHTTWETSWDDPDKGECLIDVGYTSEDVQADPTGEHHWIFVTPAKIHLAVTSDEGVVNFDVPYSIAHALAAVLTEFTR